MATDQLADTNRTRMEHLLLSVTTIGSKEFAIVSMRLGKNLIAEANKSISSIDIWDHSDQEFPSGSRKSGNEMSVDFGRNMDDKIGMNPLRTIGIPRPHITSTRLRNCNIFDLVVRGLVCHGTAKSKSENLRVKKIRKD